VNQINHIFGDFMTPKFNLEVPFETKPPRLKDLVNRHMMGQVWVRDTPFGPVTDSLILSEKFNVRHDNILRAIKKCQNELSHNTSYRLDKNIIESFYFAGAKGKERKERKVDVTEFGLALLLLYINSPKARQISAEILYRFLVLKTYVTGLNERQIGAIKGYYRNQIE
jgi:phage regulator Rha-like protein